MVVTFDYCVKPNPLLLADIMQVILLCALSHFRADPQHVDPRLPFRPRLAQRLTQYLEHFNGILTRMYIFPRGKEHAFGGS